MTGKQARPVDAVNVSNVRARKFDNVKLAYLDYLGRSLGKDILDVIITGASIFIIMEPRDCESIRYVKETSTILTQMLQKKAWIVKNHAAVSEQGRDLFSTPAVTGVSTERRGTSVVLHVKVRPSDIQAFYDEYKRYLLDIKHFLSLSHGNDVKIHVA